MKTRRETLALGAMAVAAAVVGPYKYPGNIWITVHHGKFESNIPSVNEAKTLTQAIRLFHEAVQEANRERGRPVSPFPQELIDWERAPAVGDEII